MDIPSVPLAIRRKHFADLASMRRWLGDVKTRTDVVNTHSSTDSWLTAIACATLRDAPPIVRTRHVSTVVNSHVTTRWLYSRACAHIVTTGEALRRQLASELRLPQDRLTSVPTGIDLSRFVPGEADVARRRLGLRQRRTLGIVATLRDWKGHDHLLEALALNRERWRDWDVIIVGDGPHRPKLVAHLAALELGNVHFVGHQPDVVPWLQALDLFTLPSYGEEGVPQAIMQAMACGIPVVSTRWVIDEAVSHELTGLLVARGLRPRQGLRACAMIKQQLASAPRPSACSRDFGIDRCSIAWKAFSTESADWQCVGSPAVGSRALSPQSVSRMLTTLRPQPDAEHGVYWTSNLQRTGGAAPNGLLHTRLSIIDPRSEAGGRWPIPPNIWISYNGEVYDWADVPDSCRQGFRFRTRSDTEFILHAYEQWGIECLKRLRGMFAIAIVDLRRRVVYVARDRLGLKPVVYTHRTDGFAFASTIRALLPWLPREARPFSAEGIDAYLAHRAIPAPRTVFTGVERLPAAHYLRYDLATGDLTDHEYWRPEASPRVVADV
jgi:glycosyltransferase involved in cell wall biosynthesis